MQDVVALNILEEVVESEKENYQELSINIDTGGLAARRILKKLIAAGEAAPAAASPAEPTAAGAV
jgi:vanillate O-demethylase monooxygenase subunit